MPFLHLMHETVLQRKPLLTDISVFLIGQFQGHNRPATLQGEIDDRYSTQ